MADVALVPGLWEQIRLVIRLRWRILRNNLRKKNNRWDLLGMILASILGALLVAALCVAFFFLGYTFLSTGRPAWITLLMWGICVFWQLFPMFTAGFGVAFDFRNMLRFPLSLRAFYIISLAYGFADFAAIASICWLIALTAGATVAMPGILPVMLIVGVLFVLMNVTLERTIGSWLERILARRRAREMFFALFILFVVSVQFISPLMQRYGHAAQPWAQRAVPYLSIFPPSLAGQAIAGAVRLESPSVLLGLAGLLLYIVLFSVFLWLRLAAQFRGEELSESAAPSSVVARSRVRTSHSSDALGMLSPQIAAVLRKGFRYLTRNSFAFFLLIMPPVFVLLFATQFSGKHPTALKHSISSDLFFPGMMAYLILILMSPAYNGFAFDGKGIQSYFTAPVSFRDVFIAKNILQVMLVAGELALSALAFFYLAGVPAFPVIVSTLAAVVFIVAGQLAIANWSSLSFPRKLNFGQMRGQRQSGMAALIAFATQIILGVIGGPVLFMSRWTGNVWLPAEIFAFFAGAAVLGYLSSLDPLARLAEKKKETLLDALCR